jgi:hypothetical protein
MLFFMPWNSSCSEHEAARKAGGVMDSGDRTSSGMGPTADELRFQMPVRLVKLESPLAIVILDAPCLPRGTSRWPATKARPVNSLCRPSERFPFKSGGRPKPKSTAAFVGSTIKLSKSRDASLGSRLRPMRGNFSANIRQGRIAPSSDVVRGSRRTREKAAYPT